MADPVVTLDPERVVVAPGELATVTVGVTNTGTIVEGYSIEVLGEAAGWAESVPAELSVYPQQSETAMINFSPPAGSQVAGGVVAFGVRARSVVDADASSVAEGEVEVGTVVGLQAEVSPVTSTGRWRGQHSVRFSNSGNAPARLRVVASDPDEALGFLIRPDEIELPMAGSATVRVFVRTRKPFLRGSAVRLPFQVVGLDWSEDGAADGADPAAPAPPAQPGPPDAGRPTVDAALNQKPLLTRMTMIIGALLVAGLIAGIIFAWTRPQPPPAFAELGTPRAPELTAEAVGPDRIRLTWTPIERVQSYRLLTIDPTTAAVAAPPQDLAADQSQSEVKGLTPATEFCFELQAVRGELQSPRSERACATTATAPASPSPSAPVSSAPPPSSATSAGGSQSGPAGGSAAASASGSLPASSSASGAASPAGPGSGTDPLLGGVWIAFAESWGQPVTSEAPQQLIEELQLEGVDAELLDSADYPNLRYGGLPLAVPSTVVYVGPFSNEAEALQMCTTIDQLRGIQPTCLPAQPDPPQ